MTNYKHLEQLLTLLDAKEPEVVSAIITAFAPPQPYLVASRQHKGEISHNLVWEKYVDAEFKCVKCGGRMKLSLEKVEAEGEVDYEVLCGACKKVAEGF